MRNSGNSEYEEKVLEEELEEEQNTNREDEDEFPDHERALYVDDNWTPLHIWMSKFNISKFKTLFESKKYDVNAVTREGNRTALHIAVDERCEKEDNRTEAINLLASHGANPEIHDCVEATPLHFCVNYSHLEAVETLIQLGAEVNIDNREPEHAHDRGCGCGMQAGL